MSLKKLQWDSDFFEINVYKTSVESDKFDLDSLDNKLEKGSLVYIFSQNILNYSHILLADTKVTYTLNLGQYITSPLLYKEVTQYEERQATKILLNLAVQSGHMSRFFNDTNFARAKAVELYHTWIQKSVSGELSDRVLVFRTQDTIAGMITLKSHDNTGKIGLISVDQKLRGQGIGKKLLSSAIHYFLDLGMEEITVETQENNIAACKSYENLGFVLTKKEYIYHYWA